MPIIIGVWFRHLFENHINNVSRGLNDYKISLPSTSW